MLAATQCELLFLLFLKIVKLLVKHNKILDNYYQIYIISIYNKIYEYKEVKLCQEK